VVLSNAVGDARFGTDPYLVAQRPKSVLSVALAAQRRLVGVLYLENAATANAFFPARLELTALLASQAAIAIDNARLVLTGVGSEVEHPLIRLNIDLGSVVTRGTLQSGVAYALARFGGPTGPNEGRAWRPR